MSDPVPGYIIEELADFLRSRRTGTLAIDIQTGVIKGARWEKIAVTPRQADSAL